MTGNKPAREVEENDRPSTAETTKVTAPQQEDERGACKEFIPKEGRQLTNNWELLTDDDEEVQGEVLGETAGTLPHAPMGLPQRRIRTGYL